MFSEIVTFSVFGHTQSQSFACPTSSVLYTSLLSFTALDLLISVAFFLEIQVASISLSTLCAELSVWNIRRELFSVFLNIRINSSPREVWTSQSLELPSADQRADTNRGIQRALFSSSLFHSFRHHIFSFLRTRLSRSSRPSLSLHLLLDPEHSRADYSVHREVCVIGKAGKGTSKGRRFWGCIVLRVASDREYPTRRRYLLYLLLRIVRS